MDRTATAARPGTMALRRMNTSRLADSTAPGPHHASIAAHQLRLNGQICMATVEPMTTTPSAGPDDATKRLLPWLVAVAFFMQSLDTTILNTAVPAIARAMEVTPLNMKSVLASYTLSLAVFISISGWMADRFGTPRVFANAIGL